MTARLLTLRRLPISVSNPADAVIAESINLRCTVCGTRWAASLAPFGDEIDPKESTCPRCTPMPPDAA